jgi:hypothetical protein
MKASKSFKYCVDGNNTAEINQGDEVPEIAQAYALKNGYSEKATQPPQNKAAKPQLRNKSK